MSRAEPYSTIGGSTVLSAANIHITARALAFASSGSRPVWRWAMCRMIAPDSKTLIGGPPSSGE